MQEETISREEAFKLLYMDGITESEIDYTAMLKAYNTYLWAISNPDCSAYKNNNMLLLVTVGFAYFHQKILGQDEEIEANDMAVLFLTKASEINQKLQEPQGKENLTMADYIYLRSYYYVAEMSNKDCRELEEVCMGYLVENIYRIEKMLTPQNKKVYS